MMSHKGHKEKATFEVCDLGKYPLIIGFTSGCTSTTLTSTGGLATSSSHDALQSATLLRLRKEEPRHSDIKPQ